MSSNLQSNSNTETIDPKEFAAAMEEAKTSTATYTHQFRKPFVYNNTNFEKLEFDWGELNGGDSMDIEVEMRQLKIPLVVPSLSSEYLIRMAAKACKQPIGSDALKIMPLADFNKIRSKARSFLLMSEQ